MNRRLRASRALRALLRGLALRPAALPVRALSTDATGRFRTLATVPDLAGAPGSWTQVMMAGAFTDPRYGDFVIDRAYMEGLARNFAALDLPVPIDRDHSPYTTGSTEAMGWVKQLQVRDDETLWAYVVWTPEGVALIESGSYRYFSPEFIDDYVDKHGTGHGPALLGGGLTNRPFLTGMAEVSLALHASHSLDTLQTDALILSAGHAVFRSSPSPSKERTVDREALISLYGLPADATDEAILSAATAARQAQIASQAASQGEESAAPSEAEVAALSRATAAMSRVRDTVLDAAITEGRLVPALRDHMVKTWDREVEGTGLATETEAMIAALPVVLATGPRGVGGAAAVVAGSTDATSLPADAPRSDRLHAKARELMAARPGLGYRDAAMEADRLVPEDRTHILAAQREVA